MDTREEGEENLRMGDTLNVEGGEISKIQCIPIF